MKNKNTYLGQPTTIGELKRLISGYNNETSFGFRNQPLQELQENIIGGNTYITFNEIPMNKNCICETAAARYRCRDYDPGTGGCDRMATEVKEPETTPFTETANDMSNMWIESMKQDGFSYSQMLQVFALARQKYEELKRQKP